MTKLRSTWMLGLIALMLLVAGCVDLEWETVVGSSGEVEQTTFRFITADEDMFQEAWDDLVEDQAEYGALHPYVQVSNRQDDARYVIEVAADFAGARQEGVDLEEMVRQSPSLEVLYDVLQGAGIDPETGFIYADYVFEPSEEFSDPFLRLLMADMGYASPVMRTITHMPGDIVSDVTAVSRHQANIVQLDSDTVQAEVNLTELDQILRLRIESYPEAGWAAELKPVEVKPTQANPPVAQERPLLAQQSVKPDEGAQQRVPVQAWEPFARSPEPPQLIERVNLSGFFQLPLDNKPGGMQLTETIFVQDVSIREKGLLGPELVGEIVNVGAESYRWVGLGVSFFDRDGHLVDYQTLMIPNVGAGEQRGFKKYLYTIDIDEAVTYRLEWHFGF